MELRNDQPRKIQCARSANSGSTWGNPVNVDGINNGNENEVRASPVISANNERVIVVWSETNDGSGASSDPDIVYSMSTNDGQVGQISKISPNIITKQILVLRP